MNHDRPSPAGRTSGLTECLVALLYYTVGLITTPRKRTPILVVLRMTSNRECFPEERLRQAMSVRNHTEGLAKMHMDSFRIMLSCSEKMKLTREQRHSIVATLSRLLSAELSELEPLSGSSLVLAGRVSALTMSLEDAENIASGAAIQHGLSFTIAWPIKSNEWIALYHGGDADNLIALRRGFRILSPQEKMLVPSTGHGKIGFSATTSRQIASRYSSAFGNSKILCLYLRADAWIIAIDSGGRGIDEFFSDDELGQLQIDGCDAVCDPGNEEKEYRILSERNVSFSKT